MSQPTPAQLQALLQFAAQKLGTTPEQLAATVSQNGYDGLLSSLSDSSRKTLETLVSDKSKAEALLSSPQVQAFLKRRGQ
ncbi:MAG: hypothetical protein IKV35_06815 [Clostridia bacterium]|nr:hypothetical protein [Clostridia bacterium]